MVQNKKHLFICYSGIMCINVFVSLLKLHSVYYNPRQSLFPHTAPTSGEKVSVTATKVQRLLIKAQHMLIVKYSYIIRAIHFSLLTHIHENFSDDDLMNKSFCEWCIVSQTDSESVILPAASRHQMTDSHLKHHVQNQLNIHQPTGTTLHTNKQ